LARTLPLMVPFCRCWPWLWLWLFVSTPRENVGSECALDDVVSLFLPYPAVIVSFLPSLLLLHVLHVLGGPAALLATPILMLMFGLLFAEFLLFSPSFSFHLCFLWCCRCSGAYLVLLLLILSSTDSLDDSLQLGLLFCWFGLEVFLWTGLVFLLAFVPHFLFASRSC